MRLSASQALRFSAIRWMNKAKGISMLSALALALLVLSLLAIPRVSERRVEMVGDGKAVQSAADDCAKDPHCIPSVNTLVQKAAELCGQDPSCICNWQSEARKCFLQEVKRNPKLARDATALVKLINRKQQVAREKAALAQRIHKEHRYFEAALSDGRKDVRWHDLIGAKVDLEKAAKLHDEAGGLSKDGSRQDGEEVHQLKHFARQIARARWRQRREARRGRGQRHRRDQEHSQPSQVENQISALTKAVESLGSKVSSIEQKDQVRSRNPKAVIRDLAKEVAQFTGHASDLRHTSAWRESGSEPRSLNRQEESFARAVSKGERLAAEGERSAAKNELRKAEFYHAGVARLKHEPPDARCRNDLPLITPHQYHGLHFQYFTTSGSLSRLSAQQQSGGCEALRSSISNIGEMESRRPWVEDRIRGRTETVKAAGAPLRPAQERSHAFREVSDSSSLPPQAQKDSATNSWSNHELPDWMKGRWTNQIQRYFEED